MYDLELAPYDVAGSMAHAIMLAETAIIEKDEIEKEILSFL